MDNKVSRYIVMKIKETAEFIRNNPNLILCESDMQCHLFRYIYDEINTLDEYQIYSELHWYSDIEKLEHRADISLIKSKNLGKIEKNGSFVIYDKPNNFILELKFNSSTSILNKKIEDGVHKDIQKVNGLVKMNTYLEGYTILFNRSESEFKLSSSKTFLNEKCHFIEENI